MTAEWNEYVVKAQEAVEKVLSVGDTYVDQFEVMFERSVEAQKRIHKLLYWLDMDRETFERMSEQEQADHMHIMEEVQGIKDALLGKEKADG